MCIETTWRTKPFVDVSASLFVVTERTDALAESVGPFALVDGQLSVRHF